MHKVQKVCRLTTLIVFSLADALLEACLLHALTNQDSQKCLELFKLSVSSRAVLLLLLATLCLEIVSLFSMGGEDVCKPQCIPRRYQVHSCGDAAGGACKGDCDRPVPLRAAEL